MQVENIKQLLRVLYYSSNYKGVIELANIIESEYKLFHNEDIKFMTLTYQLMSYYALNDFQQVYSIYKQLNHLQLVSNKPEHQVIFKLFAYITKYVGNDLEKIEETLQGGLEIALQLKDKERVYTYLFLHNYAFVLKDQAKYREMERQLTFLIEKMRLDKDVPFLLRLRVKLKLLEAYLYNSKKQLFERLRDEIGLIITAHHNNFIRENVYYELLKLKYEIVFHSNNLIIYHIKRFDRKLEQMGVIDVRFELYQFMLNNCDEIEGLDPNEYKLKLKALQKEIFILQDS